MAVLEVPLFSGFRADIESLEQVRGWGGMGLGWGWDWMGLGWRWGWDVDLYLGGVPFRGKVEPLSVRALLKTHN